MAAFAAATWKTWRGPVLLYQDSEKFQQAATSARTAVPRQTWCSSIFRNPNLTMLGAIASVAAATFSFGRHAGPGFGTQRTGIRRAGKVFRRAWKQTYQKKKVKWWEKESRIYVSDLPPEAKDFKGAAVTGKLPEMPPGILQGQGNDLEMAKDSLKRLSGMLEKKLRPHNRYKKPELRLKKMIGNPYSDRVMLCKCCAHQENLVRGSDPKKLCQNSTLLELDMTSQFTRENVMVVSCALAQMIRDEVWVTSDPEEEHGFARADKRCKQAGAAFPVQVCRACRKTSFEEGREFITCERCRGVHYCSEACKGKHYFQHKATCTKPSFPHRLQYGISEELNELRKEILPLTKLFSVKQVGHHMLPWRKKHYEALRGVSNKALPVMRKQLAPASVTGAITSAGSPEAAMVATPRKPKFATSKPKRAAKIDEEPDEFMVMSFGMTKEAYMRKQRELQETEEERESRVAVHLAGVNDLFYGGQPDEDEGLSKEETAMMQAAVPEERDSSTFTPLYLKEGALERLKEAVSNKRDKPVMRPPWKGFAVEEPGKREVDAALVERKEGVVTKDLRWRIKEMERKSGRKFSEEQIKAWEKVAEMDQTNEKYKKKIEPGVDREKMADWGVPLKPPASWN